MAKEIRMKFADIIKRYLAGDTSLSTEIRVNAASSSLIAQMARKSLTADNSNQSEEKALDIRKRRIELDEMELDLQQKRMQNIECFQTLMASLRSDQVLDARTRLKLEDMAKTNIFQSMSPVPAIDNGEQAACFKSVSVSQVAAELGYNRLTRGQMVSISTSVARRFRERYNKDPPKHFQWVDGAERSVNSYTERDRDIITDAVKACF
jgi:hypothetical protein